MEEQGKLQRGGRAAERGCERGVVRREKEGCAGSREGLQWTRTGHAEWEAVMRDGREEESAGEGAHSVQVESRVQ